MDKMKSHFYEVLNNSDQKITIRDAHSFELLFANKAAVSEYDYENETYKGKSCYEFFMNLKEPCSFCPAVDMNDNEAQNTRRIKDGSRTLEVKTVKTVLDDRDVIIEYVTDVTDCVSVEESISNVPMVSLDLSTDKLRAIRLNLTKDTVFDMYRSLSLECTVDEFLAIEAGRISSSEHRRIFTETFNKRALIKAYNNGKRYIPLEIPQMASDEQQWFRVQLSYVYNGESQQLEAVLMMALDEERMYTKTVEAVVINDEQETFVDPLTGVYNHAGFMSEAERVLKDTENTYYMVSIDINNFTYINNTFGFRIGNKILCKTAWQIKKTLAEGELIARIYGDRFAVLCKKSVDEKKNEDGILSIIADIIGNDLKKDGIDVEFSLSSGVYRVRREDIDNKSIEEMMDYASVARKLAKEKHDNKTVIYDSDYWSAKTRELQIISSFDKAMGNGEIRPFYQGQFSNKNNKLIGAEALARWYSPVLGNVFPNEFVTVLENTGKIHKLDLYLLECVCKQIRKWIDEGRECIPISVNLSRHDFKQTGFIESVLNVVDTWDVPHELIHFEITESAYMKDPEFLIRNVQKLKEWGFRIEMDDFGSGYSSLNMLKEVPVDVLKLDLRFLHDPDNATPVNGPIILNSIINMAHAMNLSVVAEGVETLEQSNMLKDMCCYIMQGYYYAKPVCVEDFEKIMDMYGVDSDHDENTENQTFVLMNKFDEEKDDTLSETPGFILFDYNVRTDKLKVNVNQINENYRTVIISNVSRKVIENAFVDPMCMGVISEEIKNAINGSRSGVFTFNGNLEGGEFAEYRCYYLSLCNEEGTVTRIVGSAMNISGEKFISSAKKQEIRMDNLTGLLDNNSFLICLNELVEMDVNGSLFFIDLNHFKDIDESYERLVSEGLLYAVGNVLKSSFREADVVGRYGPDGFAVYTPTLVKRNLVEQKVGDIQLKLKKVRYADITGVDANIGVVINNHHYSIKELFKKTEEAINNVTDGYHIA